jgi:diguanylate cyclase (GGDEF)-like protein
MESFYPYRSFSDAAQAMLKSLHQRYGFGLWMVTRTKDDDWIVMIADDHHYQVVPGAVFRWPDTFCYRMVNGLGPNIAPDVNRIPAYVDAPIGRQLPIAAYIGLPLTGIDGSLFGTLCAIDPLPQPESIEAEKEFICLQARLLSTLLHLEQQSSNISLELRNEQKKSQIDELTGIYNRRGWDNHIAIEEERCQRYNSPASIVMVDLDGLKDTNDRLGHAEGDHLIQEMAACLRSVVRPFDIVARIGGDEFALLIVEADDALTSQLIGRIRDKLEEVSISASIGWAARSHHVRHDVIELSQGMHPGNTLNDVIMKADVQMYQDKMRRKKDKYNGNAAG